MDKEEALELVREGRASLWNNYRKQNPNWQPDLSNEELGLKDLADFNFESAYLCGTDFSKSTLVAPRRVNSSITRVHAKFDKATIDKHTIFPYGFDPIRAGCTFKSQADTQQYDRGQSMVFISYAWANDDIVLAIDQWLRNKGIETKIDKRDFFAGSRVKSEIMRVMSECEVVLIFYSAESADKPWPKFEQEFVDDLTMDAQKHGREPPRFFYIVMDETPLPNISESNRIAIMAKGKRFELVCEEIYHSILQIPQTGDEVDLDKWSDFVF